MPKAKREHKAVEREAYSNFLGQLQIADVALVSARIENLCFPDIPKERSIEHSEKASYENAEGQFRTFHEYRLRVRDGASNRSVARLFIKFVLVYQSEKPMTDEFFQVFSGRNLKLTTWPYFREFVQSSFARMGWPQPIAPTYRVLA